MVYLCRNKRNGFVKIGFSARPEVREKTLQSEEPELFFERIYQGTREDETMLHSMFSERRVRGEWFELFVDDLEKIDELMLKKGTRREQMRSELMSAFADMIARCSDENLGSLLDTIHWATRPEISPVIVDYPDFELLDHWRQENYSE